MSVGFKKSGFLYFLFTLSPAQVSEKIHDDNMSSSNQAWGGGTWVRIGKEEKLRNPLRNREGMWIHKSGVQEQEILRHRETSVILVLVGTGLTEDKTEAEVSHLRAWKCQGLTKIQGRSEQTTKASSEMEKQRVACSIWAFCFSLELMLTKHQEPESLCGEWAKPERDLYLQTQLSWWPPGSLQANSHPPGIRSKALCKCGDPPASLTGRRPPLSTPL